MYDSADKIKLQPSKGIFPSEAWELISKNREGDDLIILDVSTPFEYRDKHLKDAINVNLFSRFFKARLHVMDKSATYLVYCKLGGRSKVAQKLMKRFGFQKVYNIIGGTLLWNEEELPFAPGTDGVNKFSFCPFSISIVTFKKIKKISRNLLPHISQRKNIATSVGHES
ncbi:rhodanese-like domain-containing protein [Thermodesulfobacteriota bacterium]